MKMLLGWSMLAAGLTFVVELPEGREVTVVNDPKQPLLAFHELQVNTFLGSGGEGVIRMGKQLPGVHGTLNTGPLASWRSDEQNTSVALFDLVGLAASPSPRVYLVNSPREKQAPVVSTNAVDQLLKFNFPAAVLKVLPSGPVTTEKREGKEVAIRSVDEFETAAIEQLQAGHALVLKKQGDVTRAVGAIRASESCLRCHDSNKTGDLLGAFTYFAHDAPSNNKAVRTTLARLLDQKATPEELWKALETEPRKKDGYFVRHEPEVQLALKLGRWGFITDSLVAAIRQERTDLESRHLKATERRTIRWWKDAITQQVKKAKVDG